MLFDYNEISDRVACSNEKNPEKPEVEKKIKGLITATNYSNFVNCQLTSLEVTPFKSYKQGTKISCVAIYHHKERNEQSK